MIPVTGETAKIVAASIAQSFDLHSILVAGQAARQEREQADPALPIAKRMISLWGDVLSSCEDDCSVGRDFAASCDSCAFGSISATLAKDGDRWVGTYEATILPGAHEREVRARLVHHFALHAGLEPTSETCLVKGEWTPSDAWVAYQQDADSFEVDEE